MIRVSKSQLNLLERNLERVANPAEPNDACARRPKASLPENLLERQILDFLGYRGFVSARQHIGTFLPLRIAKQLQSGEITFEQALRNVVRINETGAADWWSARPLIPPNGRPLDGPHPWQGFFWEAKAPGRRPTEAQLAWIAKRRQVGLEAVWFNQFAAQDRPSPACEPRDSSVFETWFFGYFRIKEGSYGRQ